MENLMRSFLKLDRLFEKENGGGAKGWMKGRKIEEMGDSFRGLYIRNIANIMPNRSYLRSNADIPKLGESTKEGVLDESY